MDTPRAGGPYWAMKMPPNYTRSADYKRCNGDWSHRIFKAAPSGLSAFTFQMPAYKIPGLSDGKEFCKFTQLEHLTLQGPRFSKQLSPGLIQGCLANLPMLRSFTVRGDGSCKARGISMSATPFCHVRDTSNGSIIHVIW